MEPATLAGTMAELAGRGFTEQFTLVDGKLRAVGSGKTFPPEHIRISAYYRFEGISDPDDMAILYALETRGGLRGTLADAFGVYSDPRLGVFMDAVAKHR